MRAGASAWAVLVSLIRKTETSGNSGLRGQSQVAESTSHFHLSVGVARPVLPLSELCAVLGGLTRPKTADG